MLRTSHDLAIECVSLRVLGHHSKSLSINKGLILVLFFKLQIMDVMISMKQQLTLSVFEYLLTLKLMMMPRPDVA